MIKKVVIPKEEEVKINIKDVSISKVYGLICKSGSPAFIANEFGTFKLVVLNETDPVIDTVFTGQSLQEVIGYWLNIYDVFEFDGFQEFIQWSTKQLKEDSNANQT